MKVAPQNVPPAAATPKAQPFKQLLAEAKAELKKTPVAATPLKASAIKPSVAARPTALPTLAGPQVLARANAASAKTSQTLTAAATTSQQVATTRVQARAHADLEATRLSDVRSGHAKQAEALTEVRATSSDPAVDRATQRLLNLIHRELQQDPGPASREPTREGVEGNRSIAAAATPGATGGAPKSEPSHEVKAEQTVALIEKIETFVRSNRPGLTLTLNNSLGAQVEIERVGPKQIALKLTGQRGPPSPEAVSRIREELQARGLNISALSIA